MDDLKDIIVSINTKCNANVWNLGNPIRCSRNKMNHHYCSIHQNQINKYGKLRLGNYNNEEIHKNIKLDINKDEYLELDCDLIDYDGKHYYIEHQCVYTILDREYNIVDILKDTILKDSILMEYNKIC